MQSHIFQRPTSWCAKTKGIQQHGQLPKLLASCIRNQLGTLGLEFSNACQLTHPEPKRADGLGKPVFPRWVLQLSCGCSLLSSKIELEFCTLQLLERAAVLRCALEFWNLQTNFGSSTLVRSLHRPTLAHFMRIDGDGMPDPSSRERVSNYLRSEPKLP